MKLILESMIPSALILATLCFLGKHPEYQMYPEQIKHLYWLMDLSLLIVLSALMMESKKEVAMNLGCLLILLGATVGLVLSCIIVYSIFVTWL